jgi:hypothetical protein
MIQDCASFGKMKVGTGEPRNKKNPRRNMIWLSPNNDNKIRRLLARRRCVGSRGIQRAVSAVGVAPTHRFTAAHK